MIITLKGCYVEQKYMWNVDAYGCCILRTNLSTMEIDKRIPLDSRCYVGGGGAFSDIGCLDEYLYFTPWSTKCVVLLNRRTEEISYIDFDSHGIRFSKYDSTVVVLNRIFMIPFAGRDLLELNVKEKSITYHSVSHLVNDADLLFKSAVAWMDKEIVLASFRSNELFFYNIEEFSITKIEVGEKGNGIQKIIRVRDELWILKIYGMKIFVLNMNTKELRIIDLGVTLLEEVSMFSDIIDLGDKIFLTNCFHQKSCLIDKRTERVAWIDLFVNSPIEEKVVLFGKKISSEEVLLVLRNDERYFGFYNIETGNIIWRKRKNEDAVFASTQIIASAVSGIVYEGEVSINNFLMFLQSNDLIHSQKESESCGKKIFDEVLKINQK